MADAPFIPASQLKQKYQCFGHFYILLFEDGTKIPCRSVLEIVRTDDFMSTPPDVAANLSSNALVIMMNPGSSRPLSAIHTDRLVPASAVSDILASQGLVPTVPDTTQYQIMRLMTALNWRHVRVVNLSDLRNPDSNTFQRLVSSLEKEHSGNAHSVFSAIRSKEWNRRLAMNKGPVIAAWGQNPKLTNLAERCINALNGQILFGLQQPGHPLRYSHPSPRNHVQKLRWLSEMNQQLTSKIPQFLTD